MFKKVRLGTVFLLALLFGVAITGPASAQENLGNFPDAIEISAEFTTVNINGADVSGFLFHLTNTSYGNGQHSSFDRDPDGDFAVRDVLTPTAGAAIAAAQPFGIYSFGALLPEGSGAMTFAPAGFVVHFDPLNSVTNMREINFEINLKKNPSGLIFDESAPSIPATFAAPRVGTFDFFISTPDGFTPDQLPQVRNDPGIDISTQMAWAENGKVQTKFKFNGRRLRPRGEVMPDEAAPPPPPPA
ncbi:MAG: hypothetical protein U1E51_23265 [Candidatus Binatia bacterium]|nr:hypothetical protein [Candidatus Binatia bacterium]